jgi:hypothetical protein
VHMCRELMLYRTSKGASVVRFGSSRLKNQVVFVGSVKICDITKEG